jgi:hypothetical protein
MKHHYTTALSLGMILNCPIFAEPMTAEPQVRTVAENESKDTERGDLDSCSFKLKNLPEEEYQGIEIPQHLSFDVPAGYTRLVFGGRDAYLSGQSCGFVIDVSHVSPCGKKIWEISYKGSTALTYSGGVGIESVDPNTGEADELWTPIKSKFKPQQANPHPLKPGITFRDLRSGGLLSFKSETKFYGESLVTLESFEHQHPVYPAAKSLVKCTHLKLMNQSEFNPFPYYEGIPRG